MAQRWNRYLEYLLVELGVWPLGWRACPETSRECPVGIVRWASYAAQRKQSLPGKHKVMDSKPMFACLWQTPSFGGVSV